MKSREEVMELRNYRIESMEIYWEHKMIDMYYSYRRQVEDLNWVLDLEIDDYDRKS